MTIFFLGNLTNCWWKSGGTWGHFSRRINIFNNSLANVSIQPLPTINTYLGQINQSLEVSDIGCNQTVMLARKMLILANELSNISKCDPMSPPDVHCPVTNQLLHDNLSDPLHSYNLQLSSLILSQRSSAPSWTRRQRNTASWLYLETQVKSIHHFMREPMPDVTQQWKNLLSLQVKRRHR